MVGRGQKNHESFRYIESGLIQCPYQGTSHAFHKFHHDELLAAITKKKVSIKDRDNRLCER